MKKIKFGTTQYDLTPGSYYVTGDQLRLTIVWPEGAAYEDIEANVTDCNRIELLSESGDLLEAIKDYTSVDRLIKSTIMSSAPNRWKTARARTEKPCTRVRRGIFD